MFDLKNILLTEEQERLISELTKWYKNCKKKNSKKFYSYSGKAGTGKTSVIKFFINMIDLDHNQYAAACYTGKGSLVLAKNGLNSSTIHSLIYQTFVKKVEQPDGSIKNKLVSRLKGELDPRIKLIIIDEATMVNDAMRNEILSFGIPTVFIGDNNQLPPIFGISSVMIYPDFTLTKIMRQEEGNPIIQFSEAILNDQPLYYGDYGNSKIIADIDIEKRLLSDFDIMICAKNKTRQELNDSIRHKVLNIPTSCKLPCIGEKIICRQNNWDELVQGIYLMNGIVGYCEDIEVSTPKRNCYMIDFRPDFMSKDYQFFDLKCDRKYTELTIPEHRDYGLGEKGLNQFEFAYAVSCHIMQGSQYDKVLMMDEFFHDKETTKKMRYTAITRAAESLTIVTPYARNRRYNQFW